MNNSSPNADEITKLKADLEQVRNDLSRLSKSYREELEARAENLSAKARAGIEHAAEDIGAKAREGIEAVSKQIEARPLTSLLISFAIGLTVGKLLDRK